MRKIKIITDSTTSLPKQMLNERDIDVVPSRIILGGENYPDVERISNKELFEFADSEKNFPRRRRLP